jgi:hypothetical protein
LRLDLRRDEGCRSGSGRTEKADGHWSRRREVADRTGDPPERIAWLFGRRLGLEPLAPAAELRHQIRVVRRELLEHAIDIQEKRLFGRCGHGGSGKAYKASLIYVPPEWDRRLLNVAASRESTVQWVPQ